MNSSRTSRGIGIRSPVVRRRMVLVHRPFAGEPASWPLGRIRTAMVKSRAAVEERPTTFREPVARGRGSLHVDDRLVVKQDAPCRQHVVTHRPHGCTLQPAAAWWPGASESCRRALRLRPAGFKSPPGCPSPGCPSSPGGPRTCGIARELHIALRARTHGGMLRSRSGSLNARGSPGTRPWCSPRRRSRAQCSQQRPAGETDGSGGLGVWTSRAIPRVRGGDGRSPRWTAAP